jgi:hypothetical protein
MIYFYRIDKFLRHSNFYIYRDEIPEVFDMLNQLYRWCGCVLKGDVQDFNSLHNLTNANILKSLNHEDLRLTIC